MAMGLPYDSDEGRAICGALSAIMTGICYATSAEMAERARRLPRLSPRTATHMLRVIRNHRRAAYGDASGYEGLSIPPVALVGDDCPDERLVDAAQQALGPGAGARRAHGYRNAQSTVIAPTGTIGLVMDCDTTGIEPDFALVKFKKLAGGGYFKIINRVVPAALKTLGYSQAQIDEIIRYAVGHGTLPGRAGDQPRRAARQGLRRGAAPGAGAGADVGLRHQVRLQQVDARRGVLHPRARLHGRAARRPDLRPARRRSASPRPRSRPPTPGAAAR